MNEPKDGDNGEPTRDELHAGEGVPAEGYPNYNSATGNEPPLPPEADPGQAPDPADGLAQAAAAAAATGGPPTSLGAPPLRHHGRGGLFVGLAAVAAVVVLGVVYGPPFMRRIGELRTQRACAEYLAPRTLVAYEEGPDKAAALLANGGSYAAVPLSAGGNAGAPAGGPPVAGHVPPAWREMRRWAFPESPEPAGALLFVHERQTVAGVRGVVAVEADRAGRRLRATFIYPGTYTSGPTAVTNISVKPPPKEGEIVLSAGRDPFESKLPDDPDPAARADLRFFAGRPDADDWTHFVIPYERGNERGELEMWVFDESTFHYVDRRFAK